MQKKLSGDAETGLFMFFKRTLGASALWPDGPIRKLVV